MGVLIMKVVNDLFYSKDHEWLSIKGDKAYIGITDYAQHALGSIVFVELPEVDSDFSAGDSFGSVESVKAASDLLIPVDGKILEVNENLVDNPELVNEDPYENWMICIEILDKSQVNDLLNAENYELLCSKEV
jgi:glycine cleavage system H protein